MRILKGYSKDEQKELEYAKKNMSCNDLLHNITYFPANIECNPIKDKYDSADTDERISIIRDILDFYTDKAKFPENKYIVHDKVTDQYIYYSMTEWSFRWGRFNLATDIDIPDKKTKDEWLAINPAYEPMLESVEE